MVPKKNSPLCSPVDTLMRRLSFSKKFTLLGMIVLVSVGVTISSLYSHLNGIIRSSQHELQGLALIYPLTKSIQSFQQHRGLSCGVLSGISHLSADRITKEHIAADAFNALESSLPLSMRQLDSWKDIADTWQSIRLQGMQWTQAKNFSAHTQIINELLYLESIIADDYGLTADSDLDTFYLTYTSGNELLRALEHLGQMRAYGTAILGVKNITEQQAFDMATLLTLLEYSLKPLKINIDKVAHYNPSLKQGLLDTYDTINNASQQVIKEVHEDILNKHFSMTPADYFAFSTQAINSSYEQLHHSLLPTAENLIQHRIQATAHELQRIFVIAGILLMLVIYVMSAIYRSTMSNIHTLKHVVSGFSRGDMSERVFLNTQDELATIGNSFNIMADELVDLIAEKHSATHYVRSLIEASLDPLVTINAQGHITDANAALEKATGINRDKLIGSRFSEYFTNPDKAQAGYQLAFSQGFVNNYLLAIRHVSGKVIDVLYNASVYKDSDGNVLGVFAAARDITGQKTAENKLRILSTAIEQSPASVVITKLDAEIEYVNPRFTQVTGYSSDEAIGQNPRILQSGITDKSVYKAMWDTLIQGQAWVGEFVNRRKNGEHYYEEAYISPIQEDDGTITHYVAVKLDVTARKKLEEEVRQLAYYDPLTKLPNRRLLDDRLSQTISSCKRRKTYGALIFLDLDNFKPLNDAHGHTVGDRLLIEAANRLTQCLREIDTVARFGGDEFVILLAGLDTDKTTSITQAEIVAEKIRASLSEPYLFKIAHTSQPDTNVKHSCTGSIGVMVFNGSEGSQEDIMKWADAAMYEAKDAGRNLIRFYDMKS